jgi:hypothetical protein
LELPRFQFRFDRTVHRQIPPGLAKLIPSGMERFTKPISQLVIANGLAPKYGSFSRSPGF